MKYIVLDQEQKDGLEELRKAFTGTFKKWSNFNPIEIKNSCWILPLSVLEDKDLLEFNEFVMKNKKSAMMIREVAESEFIEYEL